MISFIFGLFIGSTVTIILMSIILKGKDYETKN